MEGHTWGKGAGSLPHQAPPFLPTERIKLQSKSCSPSCGLVSELLKQLVDASTLDTGLLPGKLEVQNITCCEKDFCNRVARVACSPWALASGLLLNLVPALWALL